MERVFLMIFGMSVTAGLLAVAVLVLRLLLKRAPKALFCILWGFVAIRLICPVSFESPFSLVPAKLTASDSVFDRIDFEEVRSFSSDEVSSDLPRGSVSSFAPEQLPAELLEAVSQEENTLSADPPEASEDASPNASAIVLSDSGATGLQAPENNLIAPTPVTDAAITEENVSFLRGLSFVASVLWPVGVAVMLLYAGISWLRIRRKTKEAVHLKDNIWLCDRVASPFILGMFRPRIILPSSVTPGEAEHIIAHEQAHLKRLDHFWKPLGFVLLSVYWFNPVLWIAYIFLCKDIELACDERVIRKMNTEEIKSYSSTLLNYSISRKMISVCPLAFGEVHVKKRIKNVLHYKRPAFWVIVLAVVSCITVAVCFLTNPLKPEDETKQASSENKGEQQFLSFALKETGTDVIGLEVSTEQYTCFTGEQLSDITLPVTWTNHNYSRAVTYGEVFDVLRHEDDEWVTCATEEFVFPTVANLLMPKTEQEKTYALNLFDLSESGLYRFRAEPAEGNYVWFDFEVTAVYENEAASLSDSALLSILDTVTRDKLHVSGIRTEYPELCDLLLAGGNNTVTCFVNALTVADSYGPREYFMAQICSELTGIGVEEGDYDPETWWGSGDEWLRIYNKHLASEEYRELAVSEGNLPSGTIAAWKNTSLLADYYNPRTPMPRGIVWVNYFYNRTKNPDGSLVMELPEFPGITFYVDDKKISADTPMGRETLLSYHTIWTTYLADLNNDRYPEICATVSNDTAPEHLEVVVYDFKNRRTYPLRDNVRYDYAIIGSADSMFIQIIDRKKEQDVFIGKPVLTENPEQGTVTLEITQVDERLYSAAWTADNQIDLVGYSNLYADLQMDENRFVSNSVYPICRILTEEDWEAFTAAYADVTLWKDGQLLSIKEALGDDMAFYMEYCHTPEAASNWVNYPDIKPCTSIYLTPHGLAVGISSTTKDQGFSSLLKEMAGGEA